MSRQKEKTPKDYCMLAAVRALDNLTNAEREEAL